VTRLARFLFGFLPDENLFARYNLDAGLPNLNRHVRAQFAARIGASFPQGPDEETGANGTNEKRPPRIISRVASGIRSFPLGAKVGISLVASILAAFVLGGGLNRIADGRSYRVSGLLRVAGALILYGLLALLWAIDGGRTLTRLRSAIRQPQR
jgi:hypothetical protein